MPLFHTVSLLYLRAERDQTETASYLNICGKDESGGKKSERRIAIPPRQALVANHNHKRTSDPPYDAQRFLRVSFLPASPVFLLFAAPCQSPIHLTSGVRPAEGARMVGSLSNAAGHNPSVDGTVKKRGVRAARTPLLTRARQSRPKPMVILAPVMPIPSCVRSQEALVSLSQSIMMLVALTIITAFLISCLFLARAIVVRGIMALEE